MVVEGQRSLLILMVLVEQEVLAGEGKEVIPLLDQETQEPQTLEVAVVQLQVIPLVLVVVAL